LVAVGEADSARTPNRGRRHVRDTPAYHSTTNEHAGAHVPAERAPVDGQAERASRRERERAAAGERPRVVHAHPAAALIVESRDRVVPPRRRAKTPEVEEG
jgi:hypothetical protein